MTDTVSAGAPALPHPIPSAHDRSFVPYPIGLDPRFEKCLPYTEVQEGVPWASGPMPARAFSNDAHDPGGKTGEGIIQREYDLKRRQWGLTLQDIRHLSKDEERTIYYTDYWLPICPQLQPGLDLECFDQNVNEGTTRSVKLLQLALGFKGSDVDGDFGDKTRSAVRAANDVDGLIERYKIAREAFYHALSTFRYFGGDWIRRSETIAKQSKAMAPA